MNRKTLLPLSKVTEGCVLAEDILDDNKQTLLAAGVILTAECLKVLDGHNITRVAIFVKHDTNIDLVNTAITNNSIIDQQTKQFLINGVRTTFKGHLETRVEVDKLEDIVKKVVDKIRRRKHILLHLTDIQDSDDDLFLHSVNVSMFSILIGLKMKLATEELCALGTGALLHDIGKVHIPPSILNKPGKLTRDEYNLVKEHATIGYNILKKETNLDHRIMLTVLQHHERCNGKGYPWGISEDQIHPLAHIVAVADVYEALTANRAYRRRFAADKAIDIINENSDTQFAAAVTEAFNSIVVPYNIGETVKLSNGIMGRVIGLNSVDLNRPLLFTSLGKIDLLKTPKLKVECVV
jgi:putative nucleotidyltransferase with HDIG domain